MRWHITCSALCALGVATGCQPNVAPVPAVVAVRKDGLAEPVQLHLELDGKPINDVIYPFVGDIDEDGAPDLLIGTRMKGRLLVYPNIRSVSDYHVKTSQWFDDQEPTGRIPSG